MVGRLLKREFRDMGISFEDTRGDHIRLTRPCCATLVEPAPHLCDNLIHVLARPFFLAVFGERQLGAKDLNSGKEFL
jgi:hypothetical protein